MVNTETQNRMWKGSEWLTLLCFSMLILLGVNLIGLAVDSRLITGSPAWLKPAKFAFSSALYSGMLAWILGALTIWPFFMRLMGTLTTLALLIEIAIINLQAWRGTTSHFNLQTNLDASLFGIMGVSIAVLWIASVGILVALFRQTFTKHALGWALRLGMLITVIGSASGGLMTRPMPGQTARILGSHTVGAPDGSAGIMATGWSSKHGDLRIAHFVGLHGIQAIPLVYWLLARKRRPLVSTIVMVACAYLAGAVLLEWQALRGQSLIHPDNLTLAAWSTWFLISVTSFLIASVSWRKRLLRTSGAMA